MRKKYYSTNNLLPIYTLFHSTDTLLPMSLQNDENDIVYEESTPPLPYQILKTTYYE